MYKYRMGNIQLGNKCVGRGLETEMKLECSRVYSLL